MVVKQHRSFKVPNVNLLNYVRILGSEKFEPNVINILSIGYGDIRIDNGWIQRKRFKILVLITNRTAEYHFQNILESN